MEKSLEPQVDRDDLKRITKKLLAERFCTAIQALIDNAGINDTKKALHNYMLHSGMAGACYFSNIIEGDSIEKISKIYFFAESSLSNGQSVLEIREKGAICDTVGCILGDGPPELCNEILQPSVDGLAECVDTDFEIVSQSYLNRGAHRCQKIIRKKGTKFSTREELGQIKKRIEIPELSNEELFSCACQYLGNWWNYTTSGFVDLFGSERSIEILRPYMQNCGKVTGIALSRELKMHEKDVLAIGTLVDFYGGVMQQTGNVTTKIDMMEKEITSCPFSSSPVETCKQMEFISQGLVEVINPDYEFAYDRMMSKGDKTCHWVIKKKHSGANKASSSQEDPDPLKVLKLRFAKGEISKEDYIEMRSLLE